LVTWKDHAACREAAGVDFFPESREGRTASLPAKRICVTCPVRAQCLDEALRFQLVGVWGGTTEQERKWIQDRYIKKPLASLSMRV
jgi:WhiB family transcriptional regulator, redox-sensing transcriptional regulator